MDLDFDVTKVFQERLATSMGLDKYQYIIEQVYKTDVSIDEDFQRTFNGFYIVRRNEAWRKIYYDYFEKVKNENPTFERIITYLYEQTGNVETSFSSKMLASISNDKPIWDRYVVQNLNIELTGTAKGRECISEFDRVLPDYKNISSIKKIDSILWSIR